MHLKCLCLYILVQICSHNFVFILGRKNDVHNFTPPQAECVKCPAGFYCPGSVDADTGSHTPMLCPKGHYCPPGRLQ